MKLRSAASALAILMCGFAEADPFPPPGGDDKSASARTVCRQFMLQQLHDPASAEMGESWNWTTIRNADGTYSVGMPIRAKNGFGAVRSAYYTCIVRNTSGDRWELEKLSRLK